MTALLLLFPSNDNTTIADQGLAPGLYRVDGIRAEGGSDHLPSARLIVNDHVVLMADLDVLRCGLTFKNSLLCLGPDDRFRVSSSLPGIPLPSGGVFLLDLQLLTEPEVEAMRRRLARLVGISW